MQTPWKLFRLQRPVKTPRKQREIHPITTAGTASAMVAPGLLVRQDGEALMPSPDPDP
jgi:hypothetical protein